MPSRHYIDPASGSMVIVRTDRGGPAEALQGGERPAAAEACRDRPVIVDLRRTAPTYSSEQVHRLAHRARQRSAPPAGRLAFVVAEPAMYGMTRMFLALAGEGFADAEVFYQWAEAARWACGGPVPDPEDGVPPLIEVEELVPASVGAGPGVSPGD